MPPPSALASSSPPFPLVFSSVLTSLYVEIISINDEAAIVEGKNGGGSGGDSDRCRNGGDSEIVGYTDGENDEAEVVVVVIAM